MTKRGAAPSTGHRFGAAWLAVAAAWIALVGAASTTPPPVPPLVFVSRAPIPERPDLVPGLGPEARAAAPGGRLMVRGADGSVRGLLRRGVLWDVADPSVSWDARSIVFAGTPARDSAWRIYVVRADGSGLRALTRSDRAIDLSSAGLDPRVFARYDDFDPCWLPDGRVCFASTRFPQIAEVGDLPASNLFVVRADGTGLERITSERNGAEEPTIHPVNGHVIYARWWFNRYLPAAEPRRGVVVERDRALKGDTINVWHAASVRPDGDGLKLAGGNPRVRAETMAYQPALRADGTLVGVRADPLSLVPATGPLVLQSFPRGFAEARRLAGGRGPSRACAPAFLPGGSIAFAYDPEGRGDFGLWAMRADGSGKRRLVDLPGRLELDPAPLVARPRPPVLRPGLEPLPLEVPHAHVGGLYDSTRTFRFDCYNVFANAPIDAPFPDGLPIQRGLVMRFFAVLARPGVPGADSVVFLRDVPVTAEGAVHAQELPADTPLFEQLVDARGEVVRTAAGIAHVSGFNAGRFGGGTHCVGCHLGHSALPAAESGWESLRLNLSPSATATASSVGERTAGPRAAVDRRARGNAREVAWVANGAENEVLRLSWSVPVEVDTVILYALSRDRSVGTNLEVLEYEVVLTRGATPVHRIQLHQPISPKGSPVAFEGIRIDALEFRPLRSTGTVLGRKAVAIAEIETRGRLSGDTAP